MGKHRLYPALILSLVLTTILLIAYMNYDSSAAKKVEQIHVIIDNSSDNRWTQFTAGMQQAAEDQNVKLMIVPTGTLMSPAEEKSLFSKSIADGADGVILQLCGDTDAANIMDGMYSQVPVELVDAGNEDLISSVAGIVAPDHEAIGKDLAMEAVRFADHPVQNCRIAVLLENSRLTSMQLRLQGFTQTLAEYGGTVAWHLEQTSDPRELRSQLEEQPVPDILVALDNRSLEAAGEYAAALRTPVTVVGTGISAKAIYYLDSGIVRSLVVPEEFMMGYQSVYDLAERLHRVTDTAKIRKIQHRIIHRDQLFLEENQEILFPIQR